MFRASESKGEVMDRRSAVGGECSYDAAIGALLHALMSKEALVWLGPEVSALSHPTGPRLLRRVARVAHHALENILDDAPLPSAIEDALGAGGVSRGLITADRTLGRALPLTPEAVEGDRFPRLEEWSALVRAGGRPGYLHRALIAFFAAGSIHSMVTSETDEWLEAVARSEGIELPVYRLAAGERPPPGERALIKLRTPSVPGIPSGRTLFDVEAADAMVALMRERLRDHPLIVLGLDRPDVDDVRPLLASARCPSIHWVSDDPEGPRAWTFEPGSDPASLEGVREGDEGKAVLDCADRLVARCGGVRMWTRLVPLFERLSARLGVHVPGPELPDETTVNVDRSRLAKGGGRGGAKTPVTALAERLQQQWLGAFSLVTALNLWSSSLLDRAFQRRQGLEATLVSRTERSWFRSLLAQVARFDVEDAFFHHFQGRDVSPPDDAARGRLEHALSALEWARAETGSGLWTDEELEIEEMEIRFALTGDPALLPAASQVTVEAASLSHGDRWLRLKAAAALARKQISVAIRELCRAMEVRADHGASERRHRARLALSALLFAVVDAGGDAATASALRALERMRPDVRALSPLSRGDARREALRIALVEAETALAGRVEPPLVPLPSLPLVVEHFITIHRALNGDVDEAWLLDFHPAHGRLYRLGVGVEREVMRQVRLLGAGARDAAHGRGDDCASRSSAFS